MFEFTIRYQKIVGGGGVFKTIPMYTYVCTIFLFTYINLVFLKIFDDRYILQKIKKIGIPILTFFFNWVYFVDYTQKQTDIVISSHVNTKNILYPKKAVDEIFLFT